jgi:hypothetical protein
MNTSIGATATIGAATAAAPGPASRRAIRTTSPMWRVETASCTILAIT